MIPNGKNSFNNYPKTSIKKDKFSKDIKHNNLLVNNDSYTKHFVDIEINLENNRNLGSVKTKYKTPSRAPKPVIPKFNSIQNVKNEEFPKKDNKNNIPKGNNNYQKNINSALKTPKNIKEKNIQKKQNTSNFLQKNDINNFLNVFLYAYILNFKHKKN